MRTENLHGASLKTRKLVQIRVQEDNLSTSIMFSLSQNQIRTAAGPRADLDQSVHVRPALCWKLNSVQHLRAEPKSGSVCAQTPGALIQDLCPLCVSYVTAQRVQTLKCLRAGAQTTDLHPELHPENRPEPREVSQTSPLLSVC